VFGWELPTVAASKTADSAHKRGSFGGYGGCLSAAAISLRLPLTSSGVNRLNAGQTGLVQLQLLLAQHGLACAVARILRRSGFAKPVVRKYLASPRQSSGYRHKLIRQSQTNTDLVYSEIEATLFSRTSQAG
jgi:hypothetical protein